MAFRSFKSDRITRRRILGTGASLAVGATSIGLVGCGDDDTDEDPDATTTPSGSSSPDATADSSSPVEGGILRFAQRGEPGGLDPISLASGGDIPAFQTWHNIYDPLLAVDTDSAELGASLADEWEQVDATTWTIHLRDNAAFHGDFGNLTGDDVVFNVDYAIEQGTRRASSYYGSIDSVEATDESNVTFRLKSPDNAFPFVALSGMGSMMVSQRAYEERGQDQFARNPVGTGPFYLDAWSQGSNLSLLKHDGYWDPSKPLLDGLQFQFIPDSFVRLSALEAGEQDLVDNPSYNELPDLMDSSDYTLFTAPNWGWDVFWINLDTSGSHSEPLQQKLVRQALSYAINREALSEATYYGFATEVDNPWPPQFSPYVSDTQRYPAAGDVDEAKALLAQAGLEDGFDLSVIVPDYEPNRRSAELIGAQLTNVGINMQQQNVDTATWVQSVLTDHSFEASLRFGQITALDPDLAVRFWWRSDGSFNIGNDNAEMDSLVREANSVQDAAERVELYKQATEVFLEELPYLYLNRAELVSAGTSRLKGFRQGNASFTMLFRDAYLEEA